MRRIYVNCGSSPGARPEYRAAARTLGQTLVRNNLEIVYGGAHVGLMGALADAALDAGGAVIGVIPKGLRKLAHERLSELRVVDSMHERKATMFDLADGVIALPGGIGTIEEVLEVITWAQLGLHAKPCGLLNVCGYYDRLLEFLDHAVDQQFVMPEHRQMILVHDDPDALLEQFWGFRPPPPVPKWQNLE